MTRTLALDALDAAGRPWRIACTSAGLTGLRAAVKAELDVAPHSGRVMPPRLAPVPATAGLPTIGAVAFVALGPGRHHAVAAALQNAILASTAELRGDP